VATTVPVGRGPGAGLPAARGRAGLRGSLRSELTKICSVRSTYWSLIALVVITIGLGALFCFGKAQHFSQLPVHVQQAQRASEISQATEVSLFGLILGQLVIAVLSTSTQRSASRGCCAPSSAAACSSPSAGCSRLAWALCCGTPPGSSRPRWRCCSC
jgi:hypothetical protein